ncbi:hypothetical protein LVD15_11375 [Fulvivirga maritima]|uniref:hypothetical protein n=1 Tax=Fulvivirga maritima TaxID=2904247 RepID=UPI001F186364|nr:hypothetical protein [Fulvivirga maritima]UII28997.1 hypothetical protein LVD15_11375 [Fulvivirga maritima]
MEKVDGNYLRVNWVDGMKINKDRFIDTENALMQYSQNIGMSSLNPNSYGLLPAAEGEESVKLSFSLDGQSNVQVKLMKCKAITLGGCLISITPEISGFLERQGKSLSVNESIDDEQSEYFIVLSVNPYKRMPIGDADPNEEPPRHPYAIPEYSLSIIGKQQVNSEEFGTYHLTIGKIVKLEGEEAYLAEDFIPPCVSIMSHPDLLYTHTEIGTFLNALENYAMSVIHKVYQKKQNNDLAKMVMTLCENTLQYLGGIITTYRLQDKYAPPVSTMAKLMSLARVIKNSIDIYAGTGKEELLNYLSDWCDVNQGAFENALVDMIELNYQHTDINAALRKVANFTKLMLALYKKLHELEYIGKKTDSNIFVKEEVIAKPEVKSRRSFLLD